MIHNIKLVTTLGLIAAVIGLSPAISQADTSNYPTRTIKLIVGAPVGQSSDITARRIARGMSAVLGQSIYVDNKPGAGGVISHSMAKLEPADGYSLLLGSSGSLTINPALYKNIPYNTLQDFEPVALLAESPMVLFVPASSSINSLEDLITYAKANPGQVTYGSSGNGSTAHVAMELLKQKAGIELLHVPYKGSPPMVTDVIRGQIHVAFDPIGPILPHARNGSVKIIGTATSDRHPVTPEIPTLIEQGLPEFRVSAWSAIVVPSGTPAAVIDTLNSAINKALENPEIIKEMTTAGSFPLGGSTTDAKQYIRKELTQWDQVVKAAGAQID